VRALFVLGLLATSVVLAATPVTTRRAGDLQIHPERSAPATVESLNDVELGAEIAARVDAIRVRVGDVVAKGDLLVDLDCRDYRSRLAAQQATLAQLDAQRRLAASQVQRAETLRGSRSASQEELDRRQAELDALVAQIGGQREAVTQAELNVSRCAVRAPFAAVVVARLADEGALAGVGAPLVRIVETDALELGAHLRPEEVAEVRSAAALWFDHLGERYPVAVRRVLPVLDPVTRTAQLRLTFEARPPPAGAAGRLVWRASAPHVPADLLVRRGDQLGVFLVSDGAARFHPVERAREGQPAPAALPPDARVVIQGRERVQDGDPVTAGE
jgi:RND family efflux transporter MFP subunit